MTDFCINMRWPKRLRPVSALFCPRVGYQAARGSNLQKIITKVLLKGTGGMEPTILCLSMKSSTLACGSPGRRRQRRSLNPIMPIIPIAPVWDHMPRVKVPIIEVHMPITIQTSPVFTCPTPSRLTWSEPSWRPPGTGQTELV